ncbi:hypothetical protein COV13_02055, partial [Candidatus Woesearchaeota archaeon CG10_big_fil_rev_8_21_14_0_10_32_9]
MTKIKLVSFIFVIFSVLFLVGSVSAFQITGNVVSVSSSGTATISGSSQTCSAPTCEGRIDTGKVDANGCTIYSCPTSQLISGKGTVHFVDVEGGCWQIKGDDGVNYEPTNLKSQFKQEGLKVDFEGTLNNNVGSTCMVGKLIDLESISLYGTACSAPTCEGRIDTGKVDA